VVSGFGIQEHDKNVFDMLPTGKTVDLVQPKTRQDLEFGQMYRCRVYNDLANGGKPRVCEHDE